MAFSACFAETGSELETLSSGASASAPPRWDSAARTDGAALIGAKRFVLGGGAVGRSSWDRVDGCFARYVQVQRCAGCSLLSARHAVRSAMAAPVATISMAQASHQPYIHHLLSSNEKMPDSAFSVRPSKRLH